MFFITITFCKTCASKAIKERQTVISMCMTTKKSLPRHTFITYLSFSSPEVKRHFTLPSHNMANWNQMIDLQNDSLFNITLNLQEQQKSSKVVYNIKYFSVFTEFTMPNRNLTTVDILFTTKAGVGYVAGSAYITGWMILVILLIIFICSLPFVRRGGYFEVNV